MNDTPKIWFPFFVGDYLADTMHLTTEEHGAYLLILCHQWRQGHMREEDLPRIARLSVDAWSIAQVPLKHMLSIDDAGLFFSARLDREKGAWTAKASKAREKAKKAAEARWKRVREGKAKENQDGNKKDAPSITQAIPEQCPSPSPVVQTPSTLRSEGEDVSPLEPGAARDVPRQEQPKGERRANKRSAGKNGAGAPAGGGNARMDAAKRRNSLALSSSPAPLLAGAMASRLKWLLPEVKEFWVRLNVPELSNKERLSVEDLARCPWSDRDQRAAVEMLEASPGVNEADMRRCLEHRSISVELGWLPPSLQPSKWLRDLPGFLAGPLNTFGDPLRRSGNGYVRKPAG